MSVGPDERRHTDVPAGPRAEQDSTASGACYPVVTEVTGPAGRTEELRSTGAMRGKRQQQKTAQVVVRDRVEVLAYMSAAKVD